jgi:hypothetical protein
MSHRDREGAAMACEPIPFLWHDGLVVSVDKQRELTIADVGVFRDDVPKT